MRLSASSYRVRFRSSEGVQMARWGGSVSRWRRNRVPGEVSIGPLVIASFGGSLSRACRRHCVIDELVFARAFACRVGLVEEEEKVSQDSVERLMSDFGGIASEFYFGLGLFCLPVPIDVSSRPAVSGVGEWGRRRPVYGVLAKGYGSNDLVGEMGKRSCRLRSPR